MLSSIRLAARLASRANNKYAFGVQNIPKRLYLSQDLLEEFFPNFGDENLQLTPDTKVEKSTELLHENLLSSNTSDFDFNYKKFFEERKDSQPNTSKEYYNKNQQQAFQEGSFIEQNDFVHIDRGAKPKIAEGEFSIDLSRKLGDTEASDLPEYLPHSISERKPTFSFDSESKPQDQVQNKLTESDFTAPNLPAENPTFKNIFNLFGNIEGDKSSQDVYTMPEGSKVTQSIDKLLFDANIISQTLLVTEERHKSFNYALSPTLRWIEENEIEKLLSFFQNIKNSWFTICTENPKDFYLEDLNVGQNGLVTRTSLRIKEQQTLFNSMISNITEKSEQDPENFLMNVFTLPAVINHLIRSIAYVHKEPEVALAILNSIHSDTKFSLVSINQDTYNEEFKLIWIFYGKVSMNQIEALYINMLKNGFTGNLETFNTIKTILIDHHHMKHGISLVTGKKENTPFQAYADLMRAAQFEGRMRDMADNIQKKESRNKRTPKGALQRQSYSTMN